MGRFILSIIGWVILVYVIIVVSILVLGELLSNWAIYLSIGLSVVVALCPSPKATNKKGADFHIS